MLVQGSQIGISGFSPCTYQAGSPWLTLHSGFPPTEWYPGVLADFDIDGEARPYAGSWDMSPDESTN